MKRVLFFVSKTRKFDNFEESDYFTRPYLVFFGTILRNLIAKIPGQPCFCVKKVLFFCFLRLSRKKREGTSETLARNLKKILQNQRAGLLKRATKALKRVGLGQSRQVYFS